MTSAVCFERRSQANASRQRQSLAAQCITVMIAFPVSARRCGTKSQITTRSTGAAGVAESESNTVPRCPVNVNVIPREQPCHGHSRRSRAQVVGSKLSNLDSQPRYALRTAFALDRCCELPYPIMQGAGEMHCPGRD